MADAGVSGRSRLRSRLCMPRSALRAASTGSPSHKNTFWQMTKSTCRATKTKIRSARPSCKRRCGACCRPQRRGRKRSLRGLYRTVERGASGSRAPTNCERCAGFCPLQGEALRTTFGTRCSWVTAPNSRDGSCSTCKSHKDELTRFFQHAHIYMPVFDSTDTWDS